MIKRIFSNILFFMYFCVAAAQISVSDTDTSFVSISERIPPLQILIDSACKHSADVSFWEKEIQIKEHEIKLAKRYWHRGWGVEGSFGYGNYTSVLYNQDELAQQENFSTTRSMKYTGGLYMKVPFGDILNRKRQIKMASLAHQQVNDKRLQNMERVKEMVIRKYYELISSERILRISSQSKYTAMMQTQMAETQFKNGVIPISELARINEVYAKSLINFEKSRQDFRTCFSLLELIVGHKLLHE